MSFAQTAGWRALSLPSGGAIGIEYDAVQRFATSMTSYTTSFKVMIADSYSLYGYIFYMKQSASA